MLFRPSESATHIAAGKTLPYKQSEIKQSGHAIECRICCEEPHNDFRPATGDIKILSVPVANDIRFDSGIVQGQTISAAFDSMIGKLICFGEDRDAAIKNAIGALNDLVILGVSSNIDYLGQILKATDFKEMIIDTGFLEKNKATLLLEPLSEKDSSTVATIAALSLRDFKALALETPEPYASIGAWRNL